MCAIELHMFEKASNEKVVTGRASGVKIFLQSQAGNCSDADTQYYSFPSWDTTPSISDKGEDNFWTNRPNQRLHGNTCLLVLS